MHAVWASLTIFQQEILHMSTTLWRFHSVQQAFMALCLPPILSRLSPQRTRYPSVLWPSHTLIIRLYICGRSQNSITFLKQRACYPSLAERQDHPLCFHRSAYTSNGPPHPSRANNYCDKNCSSEGCALRVDYNTRVKSVQVRRDDRETINHPWYWCG